jgi:DNA-binding transcriptional MerR regulator
MAQFDDGKDAGALRTIGEVSAALGIKPHVLRYWEGQFPMLRPLKRAGGRRLYRPEDTALIARIDRLLNREGYTLRGARAALGQNVAGTAAENPAPVPLQNANEPGPTADADLVGRLKSIRDELRQALTA